MFMLSVGMLLVEYFEPQYKHFGMKLFLCLSKSGVRSKSHCVMSYDYDCGRLTFSFSERQNSDRHECFRGDLQTTIGSAYCDCARRDGNCHSAGLLTQLRATRWQLENSIRLEQDWWHYRENTGPSRTRKWQTTYLHFPAIHCQINDIASRRE